MAFPPVVAAVLSRYGDRLLAAGLAVGSVLELSTYQVRDYRATATLSVLSALTLAFRRHAPLVSFALMLALFQVTWRLAPTFVHDGLCPFAVLLIALYSLGANARGWRAWGGLVGVVAATAGIAASNHFSDIASIGDLFFYCMLCALPWGAGLAVRLRRDRVDDLETRYAALREEADRAVADERARIARELHDVVSHAIAVTVLQSRGGAKLVGRDDTAVLGALRAIEQTNTAALADMRRLLALLRSQDGGPTAGRDEPAPSLERIDQLVDAVRSSGLPVELCVSGDPLPVPPGLDLSAYRIVQEALTNVLKHAGPAARARVEVHYGEGDLTVEVSNTGTVDPGASDAGGGHGLIGIRERVAVAGGTVESGPRRDGYQVRARLPYLLASTGTSGAGG